MRLIVAFVILAFLGNQGRAGDSATLVGPGAHSCAEFAAHYKQQPILGEALYSSWAQGFMSAANIMMAGDHKPMKNLSAIPTKQQNLAIRRLCD